MQDWTQFHPFSEKVGIDAVHQLTSTGRLIAHRRDGMFARLLCFANAIRISRKLGLDDPVLIWNMVPMGDNKTHGYAGSISEAISLPGLIEMDSNASILESGPLFSINRPCVLEGEDTNDAISELAAVVRTLELKEQLQETLEATLEKISFPNGSRIGVHVRSGDTEKRLEWLSTKSYPLSIWKIIIKSLVEKSSSDQIVIASNTSGPAGFKSANIHLLSDFIQETDSLSRIQADYVSNLAFASLPQLIGCRLSAFSMHAALYSGRPLHEPLLLLPKDTQDVIRDLLLAAVNSYNIQAESLISMVNKGALLPEDRERLRISKLLLGITLEIPLLVGENSSSEP